jgi:phage terminase large subunit
LIAADKIREWRENPLTFVREVLGAEPDAWQHDVLMQFPSSPRQAMACSKGPGKTALLAWLAWNFLLTRRRPKMAATSITGDNLADGLWAEMAKWQAKSALLSSLFTWTKTRITCNEAPAEWFMSARSWPKGGDPNQQADTLAGLHADNLMFIIDEAGGIPDAVMAAAEAGLANAGLGGKEAHIVMAGNPTHLEGPLYRACTTELDLWKVYRVSADPDDPMRTPRVSVEWARQQIQKYGKDNPWVLVNVFGKFPPSSINALLGPDDIAAAKKRQPTDDSWKMLARILGVDVARYGDDSSVIARRAGQVLLPFEQRRNLDSIQGAGWTVTRHKDFFGDGQNRKGDAIFVDDSGGYGAGWLDQMRSMNYTPQGISFAGKPNDPRYFNKRSEMHFELAEWVKTVGCIPDDPEFEAELLAHTYCFRGDKLWVEEKDQVKEKLGRSPDKADAAALTHAQKVAPGDRLEELWGVRDADIRRGLAHAVQESYGGGTAGDVYNPMS